MSKSRLGQVLEISAILLLVVLMQIAAWNNRVRAWLHSTPLKAGLVLLVSLMLAAWWSWYNWKVWQKFQRRRKGLCRVCGYDIRETKERCPECGTPVSSSPAQAASSGRNS